MAEPVHFYPVGQTHMMGPDCWCGPLAIHQGEKIIYIHNDESSEKGETHGLVRTDLSLAPCSSRYVH